MITLQNSSGGELNMRVASVAAPLRQQVIEALRDAISVGRFRPGQRLIERELCELFGVSRTSVREALRQLEAERIVRMLPNRGPIVAEIDRREAEDIYAVRAALEASCVKQFSTRATFEQKTELVRVAHEILKLAKADCDVSQFLAIKKQFYEVLFAGADNALSTGMIRAIHSRASALRAATLGTAGRMLSSAQETLDIAESILKGATELAVDQSHRHIAKAEALAQQSLTM